MSRRDKDLSASQSCPPQVSGVIPSHSCSDHWRACWSHHWESRKPRVQGGAICPRPLMPSPELISHHEHFSCIHSAEVYEVLPERSQNQQACVQVPPSLGGCVTLGGSLNSPYRWHNLPPSVMGLDEAWSTHGYPWHLVGPHRALLPALCPPFPSPVSLAPLGGPSHSPPLLGVPSHCPFSFPASLEAAPIPS